MTHLPAYVPDLVAPVPLLRDKSALALRLPPREQRPLLPAPLPLPVRPLILAVDFDETLIRGPYPQINGLIPGARQAMLHFKEQGHTLVVWTCRSNERLTEALDYLRGQGVPFDYANQNTPELLAMWGNDSRKIFADLYLDDRAAGSPNDWAAYRRLVDAHARQPA